MESILFIFIGTGKYWELAKAGIENWDNNLQKDGYQIDYLLLTDCHPKAVWPQNERSMVRYAPKLPFPLPTLLRYHFFLEHLDILEQYDYIYFVNADMRVQGTWSVKELLPQDGFDLVGVSHPGFDRLSNKDMAVGTFEINPKSTACIEGWTEGGVTKINDPLTPKYIIGALQGGRKFEFIQMCQILRQRINQDLTNNIIALWHDESMMNSYAQYNRPFQVLPSNYCQPEGWESFGPTKILKLRKNHQEIRS